MNPRTPLYLALAAALLLGKARGEDSKDAGVPAAKPADAKQQYDALFTDILKTLPQDKRALVDSAHGVKGKAATPPTKPETPADPEAAKQAAKEKRDKALSELPPEVKARVDKAISNLDTRRKEREAELKELGK